MADGSRRRHCRERADAARAAPPPAHRRPQTKGAAALVVALVVFSFFPVAYPNPSSSRSPLWSEASPSRRGERLFVTGEKRQTCSRHSVFYSRALPPHGQESRFPAIVILLKIYVFTFTIPFRSPPRQQGPFVPSYTDKGALCGRMSRHADTSHRTLLVPVPASFPSPLMRFRSMWGKALALFLKTRSFTAGAEKRTERAIRKNVCLCLV